MNFVPVLSGGQLARAVSLMFTPEYVYWGSDAGRDTRQSENWICRMRRDGTCFTRLAAIGGPGYYSTVDRIGRLYLSTAVEGSRSEQGGLVRLWSSSNGAEWNQAALWKKRGLSRYFGYSVLSFPGGTPPAGTVYVVGHAVDGSPGTWVLKELE